MAVSDVTDKLGLRLLRNRRWYIQESSAASGDGLHDGLEWLCEVVRGK